MSESKIKKTKKETKFNEVSQQLLPQMLPPRFRERILIKNKIFNFITILLLSIAIGIVFAVLLSGLMNKVGIIKFHAQTSFLLVTISTVLLMYLPIYFIFWGKVKAYSITIFEFIISIMSPIIISVGFLILKFSHIDNPDGFFKEIGIISLITVLLPTTLLLVKNMFVYKKHIKALYRSASIYIGTLILGLSMWIVSNKITNSHIFRLTSDIQLTFIGLIISGLLLIILGTLFSFKYRINNNSIWNAVKVNAMLPSLVVYIPLFVIGVTLSKGFQQFSIPIIIFAILSILILIAFSIFAFMRGGLRNISITHPVTNQLIVKIFAISIALMGLIVNQLLKIYPSIDNSLSSFTILAFTSLIIIIGMIVAHFNQLITYSKLFNIMVMSLLLLLTMILAIILTLIPNDGFEVFIRVLAEKITSIFLILVIAVEVTIQFITSTSIFSNLIKNDKKNKKKMQKSIIEKVGDANRGTNTKKQKINAKSAKGSA